MRDSLPFGFEVPISFFEKADAEPGKQRRIGGIITTESRDRQGEIILQRGLDMQPFLDAGWFNDNHSRATTDIVGYPDKVKFFRKGEKLPDGSVSTVQGHWAEGYLLDTEKGQKIWELGNALKKSGRRLGYSVEGSIDKRTGPDNKIIAKARVRNVAITNCPVNGDSRLEVLAKSLAAVEDQANDELSKTLSAGTATPGVAPVGPMTGEGAGRILMPQSLETGKKLPAQAKKKRKRKITKSMTFEQSVAFVRERMPQASAETASRIVELTRAMKHTGKL